MYTFIIIILLFGYSTASREYCYQSNNISCTGGNSYVYCEVGHTHNYTLVTDALRICTIGKEYPLVLVDFTVSELPFELELELGDNVTEFWIDSNSQLTISISPLKKHLNLTKLYLFQPYLNFSSDHFLSINFPNLEVVAFAYNNIETIGNFLAGLKSLSSFYWLHGSLVNIYETAFEGLTSLSYINLEDNSISYLPNKTFQGLPSLSRINLLNNPLNCSTCGLQWMSIVDSKFSIEIDGNCFDSNEPVDSVSTHSHCNSTESYQCFNKSVSCEQTCLNTPTSYICVCYEGFELAQQSCHDIDECIDYASLCQGMKCRNTLGSYECYCDEGFFVEGNSCSDIDECTSNPCEYSCNNTIGSYQCLSNRFSQISVPSQSVSSLTAFFIAVSSLEALLLVFCSIYVIVTCILYFSKSKRSAKDLTRSDSPGPQRNEDVYLHEIAENAF